MAANTNITRIAAILETPAVSNQDALSIWLEKSPLRTLILNPAKSSDELGAQRRFLTQLGCPETAVDQVESVVLLQRDTPACSWSLASEVEGESLQQNCAAIQSLLLAERQKESAVVYVVNERLPSRANPALLSRTEVVSELGHTEASELLRFTASKIPQTALLLAENLEIELELVDQSRVDEAKSRICFDPSADYFGVRALVTRTSLSVLRILDSNRLSAAKAFGALLEELEAQSIVPLFIARALSDNSCTIAIASSEADRISKSLSQVLVEPEVYAAIGIVGSQMKQRAGVSGRVFQTLAHNGISVAAIAQGSDELSISVLLAEGDAQKATTSLHDALFLSAKNHLHCMLIGPGSIGSEALELIRAHNAGDSRTAVRVVGIANTKDCLFDEEGISPTLWNERVKGQTARPLNESINRFKAMNLPNSVLIDCTASEEVPNEYQRLFEQSISIVTPNKKGLSASYADYQVLRESARRHNAKWYYETTVGAGLPIIGTLHDLLGSGDSVLRIDAVLSGTLSYLFNTYDAQVSFAKLVAEAQAQGITEPDPREDLNGMDVARKLLILARESSFPAEFEQIDIQAPVPDVCLETDSVESFYQVLEAQEAEMSAKFNKARSEDKRLRYIASLSPESYSVSLQAVDRLHPFYELSGTDNILAIRTQRYNTQPMVIRGPGAGVAVTAAGVFADVLRVGSFLE